MERGVFGVVLSGLMFVSTLIFAGETTDKSSAPAGVQTPQGNVQVAPIASEALGAKELKLPILPKGPKPADFIGQNEPPPLPGKLGGGVKWQVSETFPLYPQTHLQEMLTRDISKWWDVLRPMMALKPGTVVADIGCGTGNFAFPIAREVGPTGKVYALDLQVPMIEAVKARILDPKFNPHKNVEARINAPHTTTLAPKSVDLALLVNVHFHYYPDLFEVNRQFINDIYRIVRPGGRVVISDGLSTWQTYDDGRPFTVEAVANNIIANYTKMGFRLSQLVFLRGISEVALMFEKDASAE